MRLINSRYHWLHNYLDFRGMKSDEDYWKSEIYPLSWLAGGALMICDEQRVKGNPENERICRFILKRIRRMADFRQLQPPYRSGYVAKIREAQIRLEGLNL